MKRFVTYLYEYQRGNKAKNIGFIRVNIRGQKADMQVSVRNSMRANEAGDIFALIHKKELLGIALGELKIRNGQCDANVVFEAENIMDSGYSVNEIVGVAIRFKGGDYFASCWQDECAEEIARGEFLLEDMLQDEKQNEEGIPKEICVETPEKEETLTEESITLETSLAAAEEYQFYESKIYSQNEEWQPEEENEVSYKKIDLAQIRDLSSPNWHLATNSFLVHGFWNYGYLVLKKEMEEDKEKLSLGVPGIFEKQEAVMAILFGFPDFKALPSGMAEVEMNAERSFPYKEKNQEPRVGLFGCWFVDLKN